MSRSPTTSPRPSPPPEDKPEPAIDLPRPSRYTYKQLKLLRQSSTATPLRVIAHIDLDAFYAQCEMVRLGTPREAPLAVRQWDSLIAVNYPARDSGITRMISAAEAKKLCPDVVLQHVATFREGEGGKWAYREDAFKNIGTDKVSLDPYRAESRKVLAVMKEGVSRWHAAVTGENGVGTETSAPPFEIQTQLPSVEKASIDEVFIDLSPLVFGALLQRYPELRAGSLGEDQGASLPCPPTTALEWNAEDCLIDLDENETEVDDPDWDDIAMLIGSEIIRSVRTAVWNHLSYTCSAGVARNKMMAKLGSGCNKPNKQTVVRNRAVQNFLGGFKFTKIRMLGGKLGDQVVAHFGTEQVSDLLNVSLEQFRAKLDDGTANWLYGIIRGEDKSEVNSRTQIKSMLSAKSFRPSINSAEQAEKWLHIFAADIYNRLVEDGVLENRRRPKTVTLHHRQGVQVRSRQIPIPGARPVDEATLFDLGSTLLRQVIEDASAWPCANLSLSVGAFEDRVTKNRAIDGFLLRGEQAKANSGFSTRDVETGDLSDDQPFNVKRRKVEDNGIRRFFGKPSAADPELSSNEQPQSESGPMHSTETVSHGVCEAVPNPRLEGSLNPSDDIPPGFYLCENCSQPILEGGRVEHDDWHFAKELELQERELARASVSLPRPTNPHSNPNARSRGGRNSRSSNKTEKGQTRLTFG